MTMECVLKKNTSGIFYYILNVYVTSELGIEQLIFFFCFVNNDFNKFLILNQVFGFVLRIRIVFV